MDAYPPSWQNRKTAYIEYETENETQLYRGARALL